MSLPPIPWWVANGVSTKSRKLKRMGSKSVPAIAVIAPSAIVMKTKCLLMCPSHMPIAWMALLSAVGQIKSQMWGKPTKELLKWSN